MALALVGEAVVVVEEAVVELAYNMMADTEEHRMERMTPHMDSLKKKREMINDKELNDELNIFTSVNRYHGFVSY